MFLKKGLRDVVSVDCIRESMVVIGKRRKYQYKWILSCGHSFINWTHRSIQVRARCVECLKEKNELGYDIQHERGGLRMSKDWAVSYWKSKYRGRPCYYFVWSHIEYIFLNRGEREKEPS